jgi:quercetin dioxygenase-like cupin family protein/pyrroloquinoline quinone (PQQ) biosynthesis protein C
MSAHPETNPSVATAHETTAPLAELATLQSEHPFWNNRLCRACATGALTLEDLRVVFGQYYLYSKNFTRYLAALMVSCEDDMHRARLARNLWEEGGMRDPEQRHAEIFRRFLTQGLGLDLDAIEYLDTTRHFVHEYLDFCKNAHPAAASAFLSLGTESIVARLYRTLVIGLRGAGIAEEHLTFFHIHMECDDEHGEIIQDIMTSYASTPGWYGMAREAVDHALTLRTRFFESLYDHLQVRRLQGLLGRIQERRSLAAVATQAPVVLHGRVNDGGNHALYQNDNPRLGIEFTVQRVPFAAEVMDTRLVRIPPRKNNERHKHPHESIFYVVQGQGRLQVDSTHIDLQAGDLAFVPRWAVHQTHNTGDGDLVIVAITDFYLTDAAYLGNHLADTRQSGTQALREVHENR